MYPRYIIAMEIYMADPIIESSIHQTLRTVTGPRVKGQAHIHNNKK